MSIDPTFVLANQIEAGFWSAIGLVIAMRYRRLLGFSMAAVLLIFGLSDLVEARTGAWYSPWWLFVWKAVCVLAVLLLALAIRRANSTTSPPSR